MTGEKAMESNRYGTATYNGLPSGNLAQTAGKLRLIWEKAGLDDEFDLECYTVMEDDETGEESFCMRAHDHGSNVTLDYKLALDFSALHETNAGAEEIRMIR